VTVPETSEACSPAATLPAPDTSRARTKRLPRFRSGRFIIILFSAEGGADPRMCRYDQIAPSRPAMGPYPATDRKDTIRCLFKRMARVFKYDAALERLCSNIVQAAVMEETMKQGLHGQPIAHSRIIWPKGICLPCVQLMLRWEDSQLLPGAKSLRYLLRVDKSEEKGSAASGSAPASDAEGPMPSCCSRIGKDWGCRVSRRSARPTTSPASNGSTPFQSHAWCLQWIRSAS
jgi:hypothetical protein